MTTPENERGTGTDNTDAHDEGSHKKPKRAWVEEIEVTGNQLVDRVKELLQDSNTKRVHIKAQDGKELMSVPLTFGVVVGGILTLGAPLLAALGAAAALVGKVTLEVVREEDEPAEQAEPPES